MTKLNLEMTKLKPCPFCGGYAHVDKTGSITTFRDSAIYCEGCDSWFLLDSYKATENDLIKAWNNRISEKGE